MDIGNFKITVVGLGLIGGSIAMALHGMNPEKLWALDKNSSVILSAEKKGIIDKAFEDYRRTLSESDIVFIALYPKETIKFIKENMSYFKSGAIITDVSGLKLDMMNVLKTDLRSDICFIGGHPMAGKESSGFSSADKNLFINTNYILIPMEGCSPVSVSLIADIIRSLGVKNIVKVTAEEHDRIIAYISHLPHIIAVSLMNCFDSSNEFKSFIGGSFRDATRVADINIDLWTELIMNNKCYILDALDSYISNLKYIRQIVEADDENALRSQFEKACINRKDLVL